jgi:hypothetical protein
MIHAHVHAQQNAKGCRHLAPLRLAACRAVALTHCRPLLASGCRSQLAATLQDAGAPTAGPSASPGCIRFAAMAASSASRSPSSCFT